jgi:cysteine desulfurase
MGIAANEAIGSVRLTLGRGTTAADIEVTADALARSWRKALQS